MKDYSPCEDCHAYAYCAECAFDKAEKERDSLRAERDRYREVYHIADEQLSDAWALSVGYDGFEKSESLKGLIDDMAHLISTARKELAKAFKEKS